MILSPSSGSTDADLSSDPGRLADEVQSLSLLGGRRAIWVENAGAALAKAMARFAEAKPVGNLVVAEAGSLPKSSKLRTSSKSRHSCGVLPVTRIPPAISTP